MEEGEDIRGEAATATPETVELSGEQLARIAQQRQRAQLLKRARAALATADTIVSNQQAADSRSNKKARSSFRRDTEAGFFLDLSDEEEGPAKVYVEDPLPSELGPEQTCQECGGKFLISSLWKSFALPVCNSCRDSERDGKYRLVTKTVAREEYLLKEGDLREGYKNALPFIEKPNPHSQHWGKMKLYLLFQVEQRSFERYGGENGLDREIVKRAEEKRKRKQKSHVKAMKKMRVETMTSTWRRKETKHDHEFQAPGEEEYDAEADEYIKTCKTCGFQVRFEKM